MRNRGIQCCNCGNSDSDMYCFDCYAEECSSCQRHEKKIYKLKLERLMWKSIAKCVAFEFYENAICDRWNRLYDACKKKLEELK